MNRVPMLFAACARLLLTVGVACGPMQPLMDEPPVAGPAADFEEGIAPLRVCFDASRSRYPRGKAFGIWWDFGDGRGTSPDPGPCHEYVDAGLYAATLTITDDRGLEGSTVVIVAVREAP
jgi:PKD repeat protein